MRDEARDVFHARLRDAFLALAPSAPPLTLRVRLGPALVARIGREVAAIRRRKEVVERLSNRYAGLRLQGLLKRFLPRR